MVKEHEKMLRALETAIEMETESKECYQEAVKASSSDFAKELLQSLAAEEDIHRHKFEEIYSVVRANKTWPAVYLRLSPSEKFKELLNKTCRAIGNDASAGATPVDVLNTAIEKEDLSYNFYKGKAGQATFESERSFFNAVALEEREHYLVLVDYKEFLEDPAGWFTKSEHWSVDGA